MAQELVRVRIGNTETTVGRAHAETKELTVLDDEPIQNRDGSTRVDTRKSGRRRKPRTTVAEAAGKKKAAVDSAPSDEENDR